MFPTNLIIQHKAVMRILDAFPDIWVSRHNCEGVLGPHDLQWRQFNRRPFLRSDSYSQNHALQADNCMPLTRFGLLR